MGHHARTLTAAIIAVMAATPLATSTAAAQPAVVRAETRDMNTVGGAFLNRTAVATTGDVTIVDATNPLNPTPATTTCASTSPVAALIAAVGPAQVKTV